ncbi:RNA-binding domain-containing protein [Acinetobacter sp. A47]|uniref:RNA-binding domain-containing protein n=1 Tax=Acinetobacter sp. A47 TaxID=1561217 RepID=UPI00056F1F00|nr:RNA-binding domain-containing protein [Acinetobacter sp. A47]
MLDTTFLTTLISKSESPILEFKSQWYWDENIENFDKLNCWGEFLKDFASLVNANHAYHNQNRYLIFGIKDDGSICGIDFLELETEKFINQLKNKIENFFNFYPDFKIYKNVINNKKIIIFEIEQPKQLLKVAKEFHDKKNICRENSIFVRGLSEKKDQIDIADENEIFLIQKNMGILLQDSEKISEAKISCRNIKTALEYLALTKSLKIVEGFPFELESNGKFKYKCSVYSYKDDFDHQFDFLYVHSSSNFKQLAVELSQKINTKSHDFIVVTDRPITDSSRRLQSIDKALCDQNIKIKNTVFLEDFGLNYIYKNALDNVVFKKFKKRDSYVQSNALLNGRVKGAHDILNEWMKKVYNPILVIQGEGGIGKTTLLENYLNKLIEFNKNTKILYMTSSNIVKKIHNEEYYRNIDLFDLYKVASDSGTSFSRELLRLTLDDGHILLVLDGIDEVISNLANKFDFRDFINTIIDEYCFNNGNCKIVFTCRNQFWEELNLNQDNSVSILTLQPFALNQAEKFFALAFNDSKKEKRAIKILNKFNKEKNYYIPFMLDTVKYLIEKKEEEAREIAEEADIDDIQEELFLSINFPLLKSDSYDYLIYKLCGHEYKKYKFFDIDKQLDILTKLASYHDGSLQINKLSLLDSSIDNLKVVSLKEHLLLEVKADKFGESLVFKYDFLNKYFMQVLMSKFIIGLDESKLDNDILNLFSFVGYANAFSKEILDRVASSLKCKEENYIEFTILLLETIKELIEDESKDIHLSNVFILLLYIYINVYSRSPDDFNKNIFVSNNELSGMCLKNISPIFNSSKRITFNFEGLTIVDSKFINYDYFWDCSFNEKTIFLNCDLNNIKNRPTKKNNISPTLFDGSKVDNNLKEAVLDLFDSSGNKSDKIRKKIERILKIFEFNGVFKPQKVKRVNAEVSGFSGNVVLNNLLKLKVIEKYNDSVMLEDEYIISSDYDDLIDVAVQDNSSIKMDRLVKKCL